MTTTFRLTVGRGCPCCNSPDAPRRGRPLEEKVEAFGSSANEYAPSIVRWRASW
jgi:hypothetical protein